MRDRSGGPAFDGDLFHLHAAIGLQAFDERGPVFVPALHEGIGFPLADGDEAVGRHAFADEIILHGVGAVLRKRQVVGVGPDSIRVSGDGYRLDLGLLISTLAISSSFGCGIRRSSRSNANNSLADSVYHSRRGGGGAEVAGIARPLAAARCKRSGQGRRKRDRGNSPGKADSQGMRRAPGIANIQGMGSSQDTGNSQRGDSGPPSRYTDVDADTRSVPPAAVWPAAAVPASRCTAAAPSVCRRDAAGDDQHCRRQQRSIFSWASPSIVHRGPQR